MEEGELLWEPTKPLIEGSQLSRYAAWLGAEGLVDTRDYSALWRWSVEEVGTFWETIWRYFQVRSWSPYRNPLAQRRMPGAVWFEGAQVNYAAHALGGLEGNPEQLVAVAEDGTRRTLSGSELRRQVACLAATLRGVGVGAGDRVAAYLPNVPEAVVGFLAAASLGAIWSSCSPDFGEQAVLDRFQQIEPKVLLACDGYRYGGREFDRREAVANLVRGLPSLIHVVLVPTLGLGQVPEVGAGSTWAAAVAGEKELQFLPVSFDHPLWVVYSSGTTGLPKPIVHGHGGILLEHLKALALHADVGPESRFFWFTTTGWMMWNYLVSGLLVGATLVLYDGSPAHPGPDRLWQLIQGERLSHFGTSAGHIAASMKAGLRPREELQLETLRFLGSTGSPLSPEAFAWVYREVSSTVWLSSLSGGTDVCTAFVLGSPWLPVRAGVIQCRGLGAAVQAFDADGRPVVDQVGELVVTEPMPSMPVRLWGDVDGSRYRDSYFSVFPGIWRHGDWVKVRSDGGVVMYGRSDSTINRHGVRMGTAEIYRAVEDLPEVRDSLVVDVPLPEGDSYMPLFVVLAPGLTLDEELQARIKDRVRRQVSPRHVPDAILQVAEIPKTRSGKKLEVPVKRILAGEDPVGTVSLEALQNPRSLDPFLELARGRAEAPAAEGAEGSGPVNSPIIDRA